MYWKQVKVLTLLLAIFGQKADCTEQKETDHFDFIVYGLGISGSVLVRRLSDNPKWRILALDSGDEPNANEQIPINEYRLARDCTNSQQVMYEPSDSSCLAMNNHQCVLQMGKVIGGQSSISEMVYTRGNYRDYNNWCKLGNPGWGSNDVERYFRRVENNTITHSCGTKGLVTISYAPYRTKMSSTFLKAGKELGYPWVNYNGKHQYGFSLVQTTLKNGYRQNAFNVYLGSVVNDRPNLVIKKNAVFQKLLFSKDCSKRRVVGIVYKQHEFTYTSYVDRELILATSPIQTAQYLMLSGVGPAKHLTSHGIKVVRDLPVGYNFHDIPSIFGLTFVSNTTVLNLQAPITPGVGPSTSPTIEALAFLKSSHHCYDYPDIQLTAWAGTYISQPIMRHRVNMNLTLFDTHYSEILNRTSTAFNIAAVVVRPKSRGRVKLQSSNPEDPPIVNGNFYSHKDDIKTVIAGIRAILKLSKTKAFKAINAQFYNKPFAPCYKNGDSCSDKYWECHARYFTSLNERWAGVTKMGPKHDRTAVVDAELRVYGIRNLRIVGCSIVPQQITGQTDGFEYMIGEKLSDIIYKDCRNKH